MINLEQIKGYFPTELQGNATYEKYMLKVEKPQLTDPLWPNDIDPVLPD